MIIRNIQYDTCVSIYRKTRLSCNPMQTYFCDKSYANSRNSINAHLFCVNCRSLWVSAVRLSAHNGQVWHRTPRFQDTRERVDPTSDRSVFGAYHRQRRPPESDSVAPSVRPSFATHGLSMTPIGHRQTVDTR